jgi:hypothetical protein
MRLGRTLVAVGVLALSIAAAQAKADDINGIIAGYVLDQDGRALANAAVFAYASPVGNYLEIGLNGQATETYDQREISVAPSAAGTTNQNGHFVFFGMLPDRYVLVATVKGLRDRGCRRATQVHPNQISFVSIYMISMDTLFDCVYRPSMLDSSFWGTVRGRDT